MSDLGEIKPKPIERYFPMFEVNEIAAIESTGFGRRHYRPIYTIHKWWARRLGSVFRTILLYSLADEKMRVKKGSQKKLMETHWNDPQELWNYYIKDVDFNGKIVLDPMMGGGTTVVEALRMGCKVIGGEINPVAWFIVKKETDPVDLDEIDKALEALKEKVGDEIRKYYKTICPYCGKEAVAMYYFWVKELECLNCGNNVALFEDYRVASGRFKGNNFHYILCPNCKMVFHSKNYRSENQCPCCGNEFNPSKDGNVSGKYYTCNKCGQKNEIVESIKRLGKAPERMYAIEYYCKNCDIKDNENLFHGKGYKAVEDFDIQLYEKSEREYEEIKNKLLIPQQEIPDGYNTRQMLNFGYKYFQEMFNKRQLLNLGKLLKAIIEIEDQNLKEFILLAFSNTLKYNNMFCKYDRSNHFITDIFRTHTYHPSLRPVESNCFDLPKGRGSFRSFIKLLREGKKYCKNPFDRYIDDGKTKKAKFSTPIVGKVAGDFKEFSKGANSLLLCGSSEYLPIPDKSVDAVITDPPYYGNVMYSELSDFFYVWLRLGLKNEYQYFRSELTPKSAEVIKNPVQGKDEEDFIKGLTRIFTESGKKLKDEGLMVFTFHHKEPKAWASVLRSVLDSGFYVTATYLVNVEMSTSTHIMDKANIEYDTIVVCRKREKEAEKISWRSLEDKIYFRASDAIRKLETEQKRLSRGDIFVVTLGKCLEIYSKYYPNVFKNGKTVSVEEAVESIREIVDDQIMNTRLNELADETDLTSAIYLTYVVGRGDEISFNSLNKELRNRNLDISRLTDAELLEREGSMLKVLKPLKRTEIIKSKRRDTLISVDRAHYLYHLYKEGNLLKEMDKWADIKAIKVLRILGEIENNKEYGKLADFIESKMPQEGLEKWM